MSDTRPLLIEIGCEELPPKALDELARAFATGVHDGLAKRGVLPNPVTPTTYCSPRRLAVLVAQVALEQPPQKSEVLGPYLNIGLGADGKPTPALTGFAAKNGVAVDALQRVTDAKGERFVARNERPGKPLGALMQDVVHDALKALPIPKPMRWSDHDYAFVRPVHWLVMLHGDAVVDVEIFGVRSGRESRGHRFHHPQPVRITAADGYLAALRGAKVLADPAERRAFIRAEVEHVGQQIGATPRLSAELCDEIANLTEWPMAIACRFDTAFLAVPQEALITTMETNQKFVPVFDVAQNTNAPCAGGAAASGAPARLTEHFVGVANIESRDPAEIRKGYERVIRPRFADAKFFYDEDLKTPLAAQQEPLKNVTYQQQLGSVWDKTIRVAELARVIANRLKSAGVDVDAALATRAASLAKCDLMTRMVGEFPELQGVMGRYYATANGEHAEVARALDEFYRPRFAGDAIAAGRIGQVLAVAERLDTLAGIFAVGMKPSGNKDPFALRRAALGLARTLIEAGLELDLEALLREAVELLPAVKPQGKQAVQPAAEKKYTLVDELIDFIYERLRGYYAEQGFGSDLFDAVRAVQPETLSDFDRRLRAVAEFARLPEAQALAAANKRIGNILRQAGGSVAGRTDAALFDPGAERELGARVDAASAAITPLVEQGRYIDTLRLLAQLRGPVDGFFDEVMVMADDERKRHNRLALLGQLRRMFLHVADISLLQA